MLEVTDAVVSVWGPGRVGMHLAPRGDAHDMGDSDLPATFGYVARELGKRQDRLPLRAGVGAAPRLGPQLKEAFGGVYIANEGFTRESRRGGAGRRRGRRRRLRQALHRQSRPAEPLRARRAAQSVERADLLRRGPCRLHGLSGAGRRGSRGVAGHIRPARNGLGA